MRPGNDNFFRPCLIWLSASRKTIRGRKLRCGCCLYYLFYSPSPCSSSEYFNPSPATTREVFRADRDRAGTDLLRLAQLAGRIVDDRRRGRIAKAPLCGSGPTRRGPSLAANTRGQPKQINQTVRCRRGNACTGASPDVPERTDTIEAGKLIVALRSWPVKRERAHEEVRISSNWNCFGGAGGRLRLRAPRCLCWNNFAGSNNADVVGVSF